MSGGWQIINPSAITDRMKSETDEDKSAVADAVEILLSDPFDPPGLIAHRMRGNNPDEKWVAYFPDDWYLTYTIHPDGLPPIGGKFVWVRSLVRLRLAGT